MITNINLFNTVPYKNGEDLITLSHIGTFFLQDHIDAKIYITKKNDDLVDLIKKLEFVFVVERLSLSALKRFLTENKNEFCVATTQIKTIITKTLTGSQILKLLQ